MSRKRHRSDNKGDETEPVFDVPPPFVTPSTSSPSSSSSSSSSASASTTSTVSAAAAAVAPPAAAVVVAAAAVPAAAAAVAAPAVAAVPAAAAAAAATVSTEGGLTASSAMESMRMARKKEPFVPPPMELVNFDNVIYGQTIMPGEKCDYWCCNQKLPNSNLTASGIPFQLTDVAVMFNMKASIESNKRKKEEEKKASDKPAVPAKPHLTISIDRADLQLWHDTVLKAAADRQFLVYAAKQHLKAEDSARYSFKPLFSLGGYRDDTKRAQMKAYKAALNKFNGSGKLPERPAIKEDEPRFPPVLKLEHKIKHDNKRGTKTNMTVCLDLKDGKEVPITHDDIQTCDLQSYLGSLTCFAVNREKETYTFKAAHSRSLRYGTRAVEADPQFKLTTPPTIAAAATTAIPAATTTVAAPMVVDASISASPPTAVAAAAAAPTTTTSAT